MTLSHFSARLPLFPYWIVNNDNCESTIDVARRIKIKKSTTTRESDDGFATRSVIRTVNNRNNNIR